MPNIHWSLRNRAWQCAVPGCKNPIGPTYLGLEICWRCFNRQCDTRFLSQYATAGFSRIYVAGLYFGARQLLVRTSEMGMIKLGDKVKMDPDNSGPYSQFLKKGDGSIIGIHPMGRKDLGKTVSQWPLDDVGHLTIRCDNGLVIIIGPSRLIEINGHRRPDDDVPAARKRQGIRVGPRSKCATKQPAKRVRRRPRPRGRSIIDDLWG